MPELAPSRTHVVASAIAFYCACIFATAANAQSTPAAGDTPAATPGAAPAGADAATIRT